MSDENKYTAEQALAINARGCSLLVSAAAGSGKTTVLTDRIAERICDENSPLDISRVLVVTFTNASAADLKKKLSAKINKKLSEEPDNEYLKKQRRRLGSANISTIHSFCFRMIRKKFQSLGISPKSKIADDSDIGLIRSEIMELTVDYYYNDPEGVKEIPDFSDLCENIEDGGERLSDRLIAIYETLRSYPGGLMTLISSAEEYEKCEDEILSGKYGKLVREYIKSIAEYYDDVFTRALECFCGNEKLMKAYSPTYEYNRDFARALIPLAESGTYGEIKRYFTNYSEVKLGSYRGEKDADILFFASERKSFHNILKKTEAEFLCWDAKDIIYAARKSADICRKIYTLLSRFDSLFSERKRKYSLLDYADLEYFTYKLLYASDGSLTKDAYELKEEFDEIYVDEYQDTNRVQDMIFSAISKEDDRFTVGDVKQSIYGFRGAVPELFAEYRKKYGAYEKDVPVKKSGTIFMSKNFRCSKNIIDFSNAVFDLCFGSFNDDMPYSEEDRLVFGRSDGSDAKVKLCLVETRNEDDDTEDGKDLEAGYVAEKIKSLIESGVKPQNIAIIIRTLSGNSERYERALSKYGIESINQSEKEYFETPEVLLALCLLNTVDNPTRDVYLAGLLKSPLFGFSLDELTEIRRHKKDVCLYEALVAYSKDKEFKKGEIFLEKLEEYRKYAVSQPVDKLIWYLYTDTGLLSLPLGDGSDKNGNLITLYDFARRFEDGAFRGLYNFISKINRMIDGRKKMPSFGKSGNGGKVVITSIHQSKGLEFDYCFVCGCGKKMNIVDESKNILFSENIGFSFKPLDKKGFARYVTPYRKAAEKYLRKKSVEEEMRVLYVALTRAREELYVVASMENAEKKSEELMSYGAHLDKNTAKYALVSEEGKFIKWILYGLGKNGYRDFCDIEIYKKCSYADIDDDEIDDNLGAEIDEDTADECIPTAEDVSKYVGMFKERFDFSYPYSASASLPAKMSVSKLYPGVLDEEEDNGYEALNLLEDKEEKTKASALRRPEFALLERKASAADKGTATHVFMQFCDFSGVEKYGVEKETERLIYEKYIPKEYKDMIRYDYLHAFFESELFKELKGAEKIWREKRFNIEFPADSLAKESERKKALKNETVLVQGVIDCMFIGSDGKLNLLDYKTDKVPSEIIGDTKKEDRFFKDRYSLQLGYYEKACERIMKRAADKIYIYSFDLGRKVMIKDT